MDKIRLWQTPWLALPVGLVMVVGTWFGADNQPDRRPYDVVAALLLTLAALALVARARAPVAALAVVTAAIAMYFGAGYPYGPAFLALVVATVTAVLRGHRRATWTILALGYAGFVVTDRLLGPPTVPLGSAIAPLFWGVGLLSLAEFVHARAEGIAEARRAAEEARRAAEEARRRRAGEERLLLARELHDVLAHSVSLMHVQASTALHLFDDDPERARSALQAIKEASRQTLQELRATVGALRAEGEQAPRSPTSGLDRLDELAAQNTGAGLAVDVQRRGDVRPLPPSVELAAYRIVQEALTNARRHSGSARAAVGLDYGADVLAVCVRDDGRGPATNDGQGHGLQGMRERAEALGGSLTAGPADGRGFAVTAHLPLRGAG